jgi:hypothetical protein
VSLLPHANEDGCHDDACDDHEQEECLPDA